MMNSHKIKLHNLFTACILAFLLILNLTGCNSNSKEQPTTPTTTNTSNNTETQTQQVPTSSTSESTESWKQFLKDYEAWTDSYIEFMKKYKDNPSDLSLISEYGKFAAETAEWADKAEEYEDELEQKDVSPEIIQEYFNTLARITQKIAVVAE